MLSFVTDVAWKGRMIRREGLDFSGQEKKLRNKKSTRCKFPSLLIPLYNVIKSFLCLKDFNLESLGE